MKTALLCALLTVHAMAADTSSWQSLGAIRTGRKIEVRTPAGRFTGEFVRFDAQGVTLRDKKGERSLAQAEVNRVLLAKSSRGLWIGAVAGGGGGLIAGSLLGERLANESGGDFRNLKAAVTGACAAAGVLIGLAIGASVRRGTVIYRR
jgi:hypothetical protein